MTTVPVRLKNRSYKITVGAGSLATLPAVLRTNMPVSRLFIITNPTIKKLHGMALEKILKKISGLTFHWLTMPDGERYKTIGTVEKLCRNLLLLKANRQSGILAFGGGVVGDVAGFVAAVYMRGIPFIQIPTTLLAQVDSSVGGKTGVDLPGGKNIVGAFYQPRAVIIETRFLNTLPSRELLCGLSEVIKYGILWDSKLFADLEKNVGKLKTLHHNTLTRVIARSCAIKAHIVEKDERESGLRALLNLGHTVGHAIESLSGYRAIKHGEAVAMGMSYAARLSQNRGLISKKDEQRITALLEKTGLPTRWPSYPRRSYEKAVASDKKAGDFKISYVAIRKIGKAFLLPLTPAEIMEHL